MATMTMVETRPTLVETKPTKVSSSAVWRELEDKGGRFNWKTTADEVAKVFRRQIRGKVVVITGISPNGLGAEAARSIALQSPKMLILASRSMENINAVISDIAPSGSTNIKALHLDLSSQRSVRKAAAELLDMVSVVDVLINNAAVMCMPQYTTTEEGFEWQFGTNHLGHFSFTNLLMPALLESRYGARVINVSSAGARMSGVRDDVNFDDGKEYEKFTAYGQSKSANLLFSVGLTQKYGTKGLRSFGVDPGGCAGTNLSRNIPVEEMMAMGWIREDGTPNPDFVPLKTTREGAANYLLGAFDPDLAAHSGAVLTACSIDLTFPPHATDPKLAESLWALSEKLVGEKFS